ncbi:hypothetical protein [Leptospira sp. GIMC2001]|uniref:hypothetical protein n=1 Tax=Leptospira sp. GIMC2001 TaxID=1513297 RepID=UPI00234A9F44|nr:hypothetical protein [Leptospira sp. GIMC2001]WCL50681.1 hypothetical protein O4O04_07685 [Leptospira sp. GIMC2001]
MKEKITKSLKFLPLIFLGISIYFTISVIFNGYLTNNPNSKMTENEIQFLETFIKNLKTKKYQNIFNVLNENLGEKENILKELNKKEYNDTIKIAKPEIRILLKKENLNLEKIQLEEGKTILFLIENNSENSTLCEISFGKNNEEHYEIVGFNFTEIKLSISEIQLMDKLKFENLEFSNYLVLCYILFIIVIWTFAYLKLINSNYSSEKKYYFLLFLFVAGITYDWNSSELLTQYQFISLNLNPVAIKKNNFLENWKVIISFPLGAVIFLLKTITMEDKKNKNVE